MQLAVQETPLLAELNLRQTARYEPHETFEQVETGFAE
jgi:hypothetical protein